MVETRSLFGPYTFKIIVLGPYSQTTLKIRNGVIHVFLLQKNKTSAARLTVWSLYTFKVIDNI